ncbi:hypothetical protein Tco_0571202 [Tanacetum coccineum]
MDQKNRSCNVGTQVHNALSLEEFLDEKVGNICKDLWDEAKDEEGSCNGDLNALGNHEFTTMNPAPLVLIPPIMITRSPQPPNAKPQPFIRSARSRNLPTVSHSFLCLSYLRTYRHYH